MAPDSQNPGRVTEIQVRVDCNGCVQKVKKALHGITGIYDLYVDFSQQKLTIIGSADPEKIVRAIRKTRKTAIIVCSSSSHVDQQPADTPPPQPPDQLLHENDDVQPAEESNPVPPPAAAEAPPPPREPSPPPPPPNDPPAQLQPEDQNQRQEESLSNQNHPASNYPPRRQGDAGEVHVVYHHQQPPPPPDHYGYRYGYGGSSSTTPGYHQFERYRDGPQRYPQVPPQMEQQPVYVTNNSPQVQWQNQGWANPSHRPESFGSRVFDHPGSAGPAIAHVPAQMEPRPVYMTANHNPQVPPQMEPRPVYVTTNHNPQVPPQMERQPVYMTHHSPEVPPQMQRQPPAYVTTQHSYNTYRPSPYVTEYEYVRSAIPPPPSQQQQQPKYTHYSRTDYYSEDYHDVNPPSNGNITSMFSDENPNSCRVM